MARTVDRPALPPFDPPPWALRVVAALRRGVGRADRSLTLPVLRLLEHTVSLAEVQATVAFARLGVADALEDGPRTSEELAARVGADPARLDRLLAFLATRGVVRRRRDRFALTAMGDLLRRDHPQSLRDWILFQGDPRQLQAWGHLADGLTASVTATPYEQVHGRPFFDQLESDEGTGAQFDDAMRATSRLQGELIRRGVDLAGVEQLCDVGGGTGTVLCRLLEGAPTVRGVLFDLPSVVARAAAPVEARGLADRVELVGGDMFDRVPPGADRYLLSAIVHDWPDDAAITILRNVREAMTHPRARAIVVDLALPPHVAALEHAFDLLMLVLGGGRERTRSEMLALFEAAGLHLDDDVVLGNGWHAYHLARTR